VRAAGGRWTGSWWSGTASGERSSRGTRWSSPTRRPGGGRIYGRGRTVYCATWSTRTRSGCSAPRRTGRSRWRWWGWGSARSSRASTWRTCAVHERLFAGVYPWAGEPRSVDMGKGVGTDAFVSWAAVETTFDHVAGQVRGHDRFRGMPREEFVSAAAWTYNAVNTIHPFREGNGRAQRVWLDDLAAGAGREFDWPRVPGGGQRRDVPACPDGGAGGDAGDARPDHRPAGPGGPVNAAASRRRSRGRPRPGPRSPGSPPDRSPGRSPGRGSGTGWTGRPGTAGTSVGRSVGGPADAWSTRSPTTGWPRCTARAARGGSSSAPSARCSTPRPRQAGDRARPARGIGSGADPVDDRPNRGAAVAPSQNFPCRLVALP